MTGESIRWENGEMCERKSQSLEKISKGGPITDTQITASCLFRAEGDRLE